MERDGLRAADDADWVGFWERLPYPEEDPAVLSDLRERILAQGPAGAGDKRSRGLPAAEYCALRGFLSFDLGGGVFEAEKAGNGLRFLALKMSGGHFAICARQRGSERDLCVGQAEGSPSWFFSSRWVPSAGFGESPGAGDMGALRCLFAKSGWERLACACERGKLGAAAEGPQAGARASRVL